MCGEVQGDNIIQTGVTEYERNYWENGTLKQNSKRQNVAIDNVFAFLRIIYDMEARFRKRLLQARRSRKKYKTLEFIFQ